MKNTKLYFSIPDPASFHSGGNLYNFRLMEALMQKGREVSRIPPEIVLDQPDLPPGIYFFDTIDQPVWTGRLPASGPEVFKGLLCHYLPGLEEERTLAGRWQELQAFDFLIVPSTYMESLVRSGTGFYKPIGVVPPILVLPRFQSRSVPFKESLRAVLVGNLVPVKGVFPFLDALGKALDGCRDIPCLEIILVGDGDLAPDYAKRCQELVKDYPRLKRLVHFLSPVKQEMIFEWFSGAHVFLSVSGFESFGMAVLEALASGLPVLALRRGNLPNLVYEGGNGLLFERVEELVDRLLELAQDPVQLAPFYKEKPAEILEGAFSGENAVRTLETWWKAFRSRNGGSK